MENIDDEYANYWETNMFVQTEGLDSCFEEAISVYYDYDDSSSPDRAQSSSKNIVSERNRRKKLNERIYALRSVVPNITKMDKASTIRDAIEYIKSLQSEEMRIEAEISELESAGLMLSSSNIAATNFDHQEATTSSFSNTKTTTTMVHYCQYDPIPSSPIQVIELRVSKMGEKTIVVSLECNNRRDTMISLCKAFELLNLRIITSTINAFPQRLFNTIFLEGDHEEDEHDLRLRIEDAIAALNDPDRALY